MAGASLGKTPSSRKKGERSTESGKVELVILWALRMTGCMASAKSAGANGSPCWTLRVLSMVESPMTREEGDL